MKKRLFCIILLNVSVIGFSMCNEIKEEINLEDLVRGGIDKSNQIFTSNENLDDKVERLGKDRVPKYEIGVDTKVGNEFANVDDADLKIKADQKLLDASKETDEDKPTPEGVVAGTMKKNPLPNYENMKMFKEAEKISADPLAMMKKLTSDCKEFASDKSNQFSKRKYKKQSEGSNEEQRSCEIPADNISCEKTLKVECENPQPCDVVGIKNIRSDISANLNPDTGLFVIDTGGKGKHGCVIYKHYVEFDIENKARIKEFKIKYIAEDDHMQVKVNGESVFVGPYEGHKLEIKRQFFVPLITTGKHEPKCEMGGTTPHNTDIDIISRLVNGRNKINIIIAVQGYGSGQVNMQVKAEKKCCLKFKEEWVKRCWAS